MATADGRAAVERSLGALRRGRIEVLGQPQRQRDDRQSRIGPAAGREDRAARDVEIVIAVDARLLTIVFWRYTALKCQSYADAKYVDLVVAVNAVIGAVYGETLPTEAYFRVRSNAVVDPAKMQDHL